MNESNHSIGSRVYTNTTTNSSVGNRVYTGNENDSNSIPYLVLIRNLVYPNSLEACSGTLIGTSASNAWVLTAKHCLRYNDRRDVRRFYLCGQIRPCVSNNCASNYGFINSRFAAVNSFGDDEIYLYGSSAAARRDHFSRVLPDVALVKLDNLDNYPAINCHDFANIETFPLQANNFVNVAGYGLNTINSQTPPYNGGILRQTITRIHSIGMSTPSTTPPNYAQTDTYIMEPADVSNPVGIRSGDSGGPTINTVTGNVVAVNGWIVQDPVAVIRSGAVSVSTTAMLEWIQQVVYSGTSDPPSPSATVPQLPPFPGSPPIHPSPPTMPSPISPPYIQYIQESIELYYLLIALIFFFVLLLIMIVYMIFYCFRIDSKKTTQESTVM